MKPLPEQPVSDPFAGTAGIYKPAKTLSQNPEPTFELNPNERKSVPSLPPLNIDLEEVVVKAKRPSPVKHIDPYQPRRPDPRPEMTDGPGDDYNEGGGSNGSGDGETTITAETPNLCEIAYLATTANPIDNGMAMQRNIGDVTGRIINRFPDFGDSDTEPLNAVKHAMFIAFNACDIERENARVMGNLHENCYGILPDRQQATDMDVFNNDVGLMIFDEVGCNNRGALAQAVFDAFDGTGLEDWTVRLPLNHSVTLVASQCNLAINKLHKTMVTRHLGWLICGLILVSCLALIPVFRQPKADKSVALTFAGQKWVLPLTVEQAIIRYRLRFRRPNLFRTTIGATGSMFLEFPYYHNVDSPFLGESNSDSTKFYDRYVHTYRFVFSDTLNTYDSLKAILQQTLNQSFVAFQDTIRAPASSRKLMFSKGIANYELMHRPDSSYVAIRHRPRLAAYYPAKLEVLFFYGLPYKDIYHRLTVF